MPIWKSVKQNLKEGAILREVKKGDSQAFVWLYDQYAPQVYRFILIKTNSPQDSEDLTSEVFFRFWKQVTTEKGKVNNPRAFLYQIARNLVVDHYRQKPRADLVIDENQEKIMENTLADSTDLSQKAALDSDLVQVHKAISQIKPQYQDMLIWHYLDDFSVKEISQILDKSENTIRVQLHRALKALKSVMK